MRAGARYSFSVTVERSKPRPLDVVLEEVIPEAPDAVTLVLGTGPVRPDYKAGQFLTIDPRQFPGVQGALAALEAMKGKKELARAYSMSSAPHEPRLAVTVKEEPYLVGVSKHAPLLSPLLCRALPLGTRLSVVGFTGPYILPPDLEERTDHVLHVVAGSGAVPNFSLLKDSLHRHPNLRHTFIDSNRTWEDVLFREALLALERKYPERLKLVNTLSRQTDLSGTSGTVRAGRVSEALLAEFVGDVGTTFAYVCGPAIPAWERRASLETKLPAAPRFLESTLFSLEKLGVSRDRIKREAYG